MSGASSSIARLPRALRRAAAPVISAALRRLGAEPLPFSGFRRALPTLRSGSPERARALYSGLQPMGPYWLADLEAGGLDLHRAFARKLFRNLSAQNQDHDLPSLACRVLTACRHGGFLLTGASAEFASLFFSQLGGDVRRLTQARIRTPDEAVEQSAPVLAAALCFGGPDRLAGEAAARLAAAVEAIILPDGGHMSRSPGRLLATLELLQPLRHLLSELRLAIPEGLNSAIERAFPMLRMLCHGDGGLSLLQNAAGPECAAMGSLLAREPAISRLPSHARFTGFARLSLGDTVVIIDAGTAGCCDSGLAFEFSDGPHRIVGSCGFPARATAAWVAAAARPAAHSTLDVENAPMASLDRLFRRQSSSAASTLAEVITSPHGMLCKGQSARHVATLGFRHHRELFLAADGLDLRGEDRFERNDAIEPGWPEKGFALRFHLHPTVRARMDESGLSVRIALADGTGWQFAARGGILALEDSIYLATGGAPQSCQQIIIHGALGRPDIVNWAFRRISG